MSIRLKLLILFVSITIIPMAVAGTIMVSKSQSVLRDVILVQEHAHLGHESGELKHFLGMSVEMVSLTSFYPALQTIIGEMGIMSSEIDSEGVRKELQKVFVLLEDTHKDIYQVRYIDKEGNEMVRVDSRNGVITVVPEEGLQNKAHRYYFQEAMKLRQFEVYVSELDLNVERGEIEFPIVPTVRIGAPVFNVSGERSGIVVINFFARDVWENIISGYHFGEVILIDRDGNFLFHTDREKEFSLQLDKGFNYFKEHPGMRESLSGEEGLREEHDKQNKEFRLWRKIFYNPNDKEAYWTMIFSISEEDLFASSDYLKYWSMIIGGGASLFALLVGILFSRTISRPIVKLKELSGEMAAGNYDQKIDIKRKDEIGQLAASFNEMAAKIKKSYENINEGKEKLETLLMSIGDGVFGIDKEQKIIYFNKRAEEISGYKTKEAMGKQYYDVLKFVKIKDKSENVEFVRRALEGMATEMSNHTVLVRKDKKEVPVADSATPIKNKAGDILGAIVVFRDASKERELERAKSELVSFAGHQLKAPLTYIAGNVEMLKDGKLNAETREIAKEIELGVDKMKKLVRDVLNISRIEQGRVELKPEPTQLEEVVEDIIKEAAPAAQKRKVTIKFTKPEQPLPELMVDPQYVREIYKNIISNAIKYTKDTITLNFDRKDDNIIFKCSDNGIGIPQDEQPKIFSKFYVASNAVKIDTKGTGLGLSIAKALIEKMHGRIWFESEEEKGSVFYVSLPGV